MYNVWFKWWSSHPIPQFFTCSDARQAAEVQLVSNILDIYETTLFFTKRLGAAAGPVCMLSVGRLLLHVAETDKE